MKGRDFSAPSLYLPVGITNHVKTVFTFLSLPKEQSTKNINECLIIEAQTNIDLVVAAPRIEGQYLSFHAISLSMNYKKNKYSIPEPVPSSPVLWPETEAATLRLPLLVLVPGLAFSLSGERLGRGGGYYDRFLSDVRKRFTRQKNTLVIAGLCVQDQIIEDIPTEEHDQRVDCLITENGYIICNKEMKTAWEKYVQQ